jgi:hypothetical protein
MNQHSTRPTLQESWNDRAGGVNSSTVALHVAISLYPSREEIEAIAIPRCHEVFAQEDERCRLFYTSQSFSSCFVRASSPPRKNFRESDFSLQERYNSVSSRNPDQPHRSYTTKGPPSTPGASSPGVYHVPNTPVPPRRGIEVSPGVILPLHGAQETLCAVEEGRMLCTSCILCNKSLQCINLADYVLCPACHGISPIEEHKKRKDARFPSGVGLGLADTTAAG